MLDYSSKKSAFILFGSGKKQLIETHALEKFLLCTHMFRFCYYSFSLPVLVTSSGYRETIAMKYFSNKRWNHYVSKCITNNIKK